MICERKHRIFSRKPPNFVPQFKSWDVFGDFFHLLILQKRNPIFEKINYEDLDWSAVSSCKQFFRSLWKLASSQLLILRWQYVMDWAIFRILNEKRALNLLTFLFIVESVQSLQILFALQKLFSHFLSFIQLRISDVVLNTTVNDVLY